jgi:hypothetical protein
VRINAGDTVTHIEGKWGSDTAVVENVNSEQFSDDPVAFFVGGGFWRTSRLRVVDASIRGEA